MLHVDDMILNKLISKSFVLLPEIANVKRLRRLSREYKKADANKQHDLLAALMDLRSHVFADRDALRFFNYNRLAKAASDSAVERIRNIRSHYGEYDMYSMYFDDAADHLEVAILLVKKASSKRVDTRLWRMDTASRDKMHEAVLEYADLR